MTDPYNPPCGPRCSCHQPRQGWAAYDADGQPMITALDRADIDDTAVQRIEPITLYLVKS